MPCHPPKTVLYLIVVGVNSQVGECLVGLYAIRGEGHWLKNLLGRYARWQGSPRTLKSRLTQTAGVGRTPSGERGLLRPTGLLTLPGEDWSPPGKRPRNSCMTNLDGLCQRGPEGEKYSKTTRTGNATKEQTKRKSGSVL